MQQKGAVMMQKVVALLLAFLMTLFVFGCSQAPEKEAAPAPADTQETAAEPLAAMPAGDIPDVDESIVLPGDEEILEEGEQ